MAIDEIGCLESAQWLEATARRWNQQELLGAARAAVLRHTGWPIGVVINRAHEATRPTADGIETRVGKLDDGNYDYWSLNAEGRLYLLRKFEEETETLQVVSSEGVPDRAIWWDVRVWRIAEVLLHSATLYRELGVPADSPYFISINHRGLLNREFYCSRPVLYSTHRGRFCRESTSAWDQKVTQDVVMAGLKELVYDVANQLFVLFDFAEVPRSTVEDIVGLFLSSKV